ncbi:MAG: hypothetical protein WCB31_06125, partial [Nitrososphaeraceae archaeon]
MRPSNTFFIGSSSNSNNNIHVQRRRIDNSIVSNTIMHPNISEIFYISWFCILLLLSCFTVFLETGSNKEGHYDDRLQMVWAEEINGTENPDNIVGTLNQDTIRGFGGNDTIDGKEAGDDISGGSGD